MDSWRTIGLGEGLSALDWVLFTLPFALGTFVLWRARVVDTPIDLFAARRALGWRACGISLATSDLGWGLAFWAIPLAASQPRGGLAVLQSMLLGGIAGRVIVSRWVLPRLFEARAETPYTWIGSRLGRAAGTIASQVFVLGGFAAQAARLFIAAFVLQLLLGPALAPLGRALHISDLVLMDLVLVATALAWIWRGGLAASVRTDLVLFAVALAGAGAALACGIEDLQGGAQTFGKVLLGSHKYNLFDFDRSPALATTTWVALFAASFGQAAALGADHAAMQRLLACPSLRAARKALWTSLVGVLVALVLAAAGIALFAWLERNSLPDSASALATQRPDLLFAAFLGERAPPVLRGLMLAGVAALALACAKSALLSLAHVLHAPILAWRERRGHGSVSSQDPLAVDRWRLKSARLLLALLALALFVAAAALGPLGQRYGAALDLALALLVYTHGILLAALALALLERRPHASGLVWATPLALMAVFAVAWHGPRSVAICAGFALAYLAAWVAARSAREWNRGGSRARITAQLLVLVIGLVLLVWVNRFGQFQVERDFRSDPEYDFLPLAWPWYVPLGALVAFTFACLFAPTKAASKA